MGARSWWGAKADKPAKSDEQGSTGTNDASEDRIAARFDENGRLSEIGRGVRQRITDQLEQRPALTAVDDLDLAVQKLSEGLEAIERESRSRGAPGDALSRFDPPLRPDMPRSDLLSAAPPPDGEGGPEFVTYSLDRLEARLEALSRRLENRPVTAAEDAPARPALAPASDEANAAAAALQRAEARRRAAEEEARRAEEDVREETRRLEEAARRRAEAEEAADRARRAEAMDVERKRREAEAEARRQAEAEAKRQAEMRRQSEIADLKRQTELAEERRLAEIEDVRRQAEADAARLRAEAAEARRAAEAAEARRRAEAEQAAEAAAAEARRLKAEAESARQAALAEIRREAEREEQRRAADAEAARQRAEAAEMAVAEERRQREADAAEARRRAEMLAQRQDADSAAMARRFATVEERLDALQSGLDDNQIEPVRNDLIAIVGDMAELGRSGRAADEALAGIEKRLDLLDDTLANARGVTTSQFGDVQDRIGGIIDRIRGIEVEVPGFDAVRENQSAILERFDRMEDLVHRLSSPDELYERIDTLKQQLQSAATHDETGRIEKQLLALADRLDALPDDVGGTDVFRRFEGQLGVIAGELGEARRLRKAVATEIEERLVDLALQLRDVGEAGVSGLERQFGTLAAQMAEDRRFNVDTMVRLEQRVSSVTAAIEAQEADVHREMLESVTRRLDAITDQIDAQDAPAARRGIDNLGRRLDAVAADIAERAEDLSRRQIEPIEARLDAMQSHLSRIVERSEQQIAPVADTLKDISQRLAMLGEAGADTPLSQRLDAIESRISALKSADPRATQAQLDNIMSRLELLKGRSIDPGRLVELFERVEGAIRTIPEGRFDRLERRLADGLLPAERFETLERRLIESGGAGERMERLERKLDNIGRVISAGRELMTQEDLSDLRADILALRREIRSVPPGTPQGNANLGEMMRVIAERLERIPQQQQSTITPAHLDAHVERIARLLDDPSRHAGSIAELTASLRGIEQRLDATRRAAPADGAAPARALSEDVSALKSTTQAAERKTRDAIDTVQGTLEDVVRRMSFLERETPAGDPQREPFPTPAAAPVAEARQAAAAAEAGAAEPSGGGLLGRFTSRQLLKRATGGRAESFSPLADDTEELADTPLEPGTDSPLSSALSGAPSSDTEFMSGARKVRVPADLRRAPDGSLAAGAGEDHLEAARRAARAAADEEGASGIAAAPRRSGGRALRMVLGTALAAALVVAVVQTIRVQFYPDLGAGFIAMVTGSGEPSAPATETAIREPQSAAETPAAPVSEMASAPAEVPAESAAQIPPAASVDTPPPASIAVVPEPAEPAAPVAQDEVPAEMASVAPDAATAPGPAPEASAPPASAGIDLPPPPALPESIGPARLRDAALGNDAVASFEVAARYAEGRGVDVNMPQAVSWYERAGALGMAPAQYRLGSIYEKGLGVPKDLGKAQDWYSRAAAAGNVKAMHNLAVLAAEGAGGAPDLDRAAVLFRQAAERGVRDSQFNLAILHARGLGVPEDLVEAYKWFAIAASSGDEESAKRRDIIGEALPPEDRARAEEAVATFQPSPLVPGANEVVMPEGGWAEDPQASGGRPEGTITNENDLVALVQKLLTDQGYDVGPADGLLGQKTIDAISTFQARAGLPRTGQIDDGLVEALQQRST